MRARINDKFRQHMIRNLITTLPNGYHIWLVLSYKEGATEVDNRAGHNSIGDIKYATKVLSTHMFKAIKTSRAVTIEEDYSNINIHNTTYKVAVASGLTPEYDTDLWNTIFMNIPLTEQNNPVSPKFYNQINLIIADEDLGGSPYGVVIDEDVIIIEQSIVHQTTLPYDTNQHMKVIVQF